MSKPNNQTLMFPGETGWEVWTRASGGEFQLQHASEVADAAAVEGLPAGELVMAFAARSLTSVPMRVMTTDEALFGDLVTLHAERLGLRTDPLGGRLTDVFVVERELESSVVLSVFLQSPGENGLPTRGPKAFDISARCLPVTGNALCLWREFGRWVFGVYHDGRLMFCQATTVDSVAPGAVLAREIKLSLMQLTMQGLAVNPSRVEVWTADGQADISGLKAEIELPLTCNVRPVPTLPTVLSRLLPEDVRAARQVASKRRTLMISIAAVVVAYLGLAAWLGYGLWRDHAEIEDMLAYAREAAPEGEAYTQHMGKWRELSDAIDIDHAPVESLYRVASCIPSQGGMRLEEADISAYTVILRGSAPQLPAVKRFSLSLTKHNGLSRFDWETPEPDQNAKGWQFKYTGRVPVAELNP